MYDYAGSKCLGGPQDGTVALRDACLLRWRAITGSGIYNCRPVRGGTTLSLHAEGRAVDLMSTDETLHREVCAELVEHHAVLGVQELISFRRRWTSRDETWHPYDGVSPHTDHIHVGQNWDGARNLTFTIAAKVLDPEPPPQDEDDMVIWVTFKRTDGKVLQAALVSGRFLDFQNTRDRDALKKSAEDKGVLVAWPVTDQDTWNYLVKRG